MVEEAGGTWRCGSVAVLDARGEKLPERVSGMESSGKRPVATNRIADWDCAVVDGGRKAAYSRAGVKGWVIDQGKRLELGEIWRSEASIKVALKLAAVKFGRRPIRLTGSDEYRSACWRGSAAGRMWVGERGRTMEDGGDHEPAKKIRDCCFFAC